MANTASLDYARYTVDLWWTDFNDVEFGLFKHTKHRAKSREFSADSDVIVAVEVNGERKVCFQAKSAPIHLLRGHILAIALPCWFRCISHLARHGSSHPLEKARQRQDP